MGGCCSTDDVALSQSDLNDIKATAERLLEAKEITHAVPFLVKLYYKAGEDHKEIFKKIREDNLQFRIHKSRGCDVPQDIEDSTSGFHANIQNITSQLVRDMEPRLGPKLEGQMSEHMPESLKKKAASTAIEKASEQAVEKAVDDMLAKEIAAKYEKK